MVELLTSDARAMLRASFEFEAAILYGVTISPNVLVPSAIVLPRKVVGRVVTRPEKLYM